LLWRGTKLLLGERINRNGSRCWQFPGGRLAADESVTQCARRELQEETGLVVSQLRMLGYTDKTVLVDGDSFITLLVSASYEAGEAELIEPDKCARWQWFDYSELPTPLFEPITHFLQQQSDLYAAHCAAIAFPDMPLDGHR